MSSKKSRSYAGTYDSTQCVTAARSFFAEIYQLLRDKGHNVELQPFIVDSRDIPQFHAIDGVEIHSYIRFCFVGSSEYAWLGTLTYLIEVSFSPYYLNVAGFAPLRTVVRNGQQTPKAMTPESMCAFILKYTHEIKKRTEALKERKLVAERRRQVLEANVVHAENLRREFNNTPASIFVDREHVVEGEMILQLHGDVNKIRVALQALENVFPTEKK